MEGLEARWLCEAAHFTCELTGVSLRCRGDEARFVSGHTMKQVFCSVYSTIGFSSVGLVLVRLGAFA